MARKGLSMTLAQAQAHASKHNYSLDLKVGGKPAPLNTTAVVSDDPQPKKRRGRMNKTEQAYAAILEFQKRRGEIIDYKFEAIRLAWGFDEETGEIMHYTPDFVVFGHRGIKLIEVKGGHIRSRDIVRFKGCRAEWQDSFSFHMIQKKGTEWLKLH